MSPYEKKDVADHLARIKAFLTDARGCGLESLNTEPAILLASDMAAAYPDLFKVESGLEGLQGLQAALEADLVTPMTAEQFQTAQMIELGLESMEDATEIRAHIALGEGNEGFEASEQHLQFVEHLQEKYPERLDGTGLESLGKLAAGLEQISGVIDDARTQMQTNGAIDWAKVFNAANAVASTIIWRAWSPKGLIKSRYLMKGAATLMQYSEAERAQSDSVAFGFVGVQRQRAATADRYVMLGECMRGVVGVMVFQESNEGRFRVMEIEEIYLVPEMRTPENLAEMRDYIRVVARANGYAGARINIPMGIKYLTDTFSGEEFVPLRAVVAAKYF